MPCAESLPGNFPACPVCGLALPTPGNLPCGNCQKQSPAFDRSLALFRYEEPVRHLITSLKFHARYPCARLLGNLLADRLGDWEELPQRIIPVPLHRSRYRQRGYNQAAEIARTVSQRLRIPVDLSTCMRAHATQPQTELPAGKRRRNVKKAFLVTRRLGVDHVAILDDVVTTGATVDELARTLRAAGVRRIDVWACARA